MVLARRCFLGASVRDTPDGVQVLRAWPGSMAATAGAQAGDLIERFGAPVRSVAQLVAACRATAGAAAELVLVRAGEPRSRLIPYVPFPREHSAHGAVEYGAVEYGAVSYSARTGDGAAPGAGSQVRTILVTPPKADTVVVFLPGIEWASVDYALRERCPPAALLADLCRLGLATFRVERPGLGDSPGPARDGFFDEQAVYRAGLESLATLAPGLSRVALFGHSVGGMHAPMLADLADAVITYGSSARRWSRCLDEGHARQRHLRGLPARPRAAWPPQRRAQFHEELDGLDLAAHWRSLSVPSLVLIGEHDWVVSREEQLELPGEHVELEGLDHAFTRHGSLGESLARFGRGANGAQAAAEIHRWLSALPARREPSRLGSR